MQDVVVRNSEQFSMQLNNLSWPVLPAQPISPHGTDAGTEGNGFEPSSNHLALCAPQSSLHQSIYRLDFS